MSNQDEDYDTRFSLPGIDDPASTEAGVIMMGLDADRLLAGLGFAALADDSAIVALIVDQARHGALTGIPFEVLVDAGISRWRTARVALAEVDQGDVRFGAVRKLWERTLAALGEAGLGELGPACRAYLAACWVRRLEVDRCVEERRGISQVAP